MKIYSRTQITFVFTIFCASVSFAQTNGTVASGVSSNKDFNPLIGGPVTSEQVWAEKSCELHKNQPAYVNCVKKHLTPAYLKKEEARGEAALEKLANKCGGVKAEAKDKDKFDLCLEKVLDAEEKRAEAAAAKDDRNTPDCSVSATGSSATCNGQLYKRDTSGSVLNGVDNNIGSNQKVVSPTTNSAPPKRVSGT
jgi:hypothetical protein